MVETYHCERRRWFHEGNFYGLLLKCVVDGIVVCGCNGVIFVADYQLLEGSHCGGLVTLRSDH